MTRSFKALIVVLCLVLGSGAGIEAARSRSKAVAKPAGTAALWPDLAVTPGSFNDWMQPNTTKDLYVSIENLTGYIQTISVVGEWRDSTKPDPLPDWLFPENTGPFDVPPLATVSFRIGIVAPPGMQSAVLRGGVYFKSLTAVPDSFPIPIYVRVEPPEPFILWDTLQTGCVSLTVFPTGNMGHSGVGDVNMNFTPPLECDTGANSRGDASVYLYDGSPVIVRKTGASAYVGSWAIFSNGFVSANDFLVLNGLNPGGHNKANPVADIYWTPTFCTVDSLVKIEKTWYAPKGMGDSCEFILEKTQFFPYDIGTSVSGLAIGEAIDWDVPSDSSSTYNAGGQDWTARKLIWMRGVELADTISSKGYDCRDNSLRYAGMGVLGMHMKNCATINPYGGYAAANDSFVYPAGTFVPAQLWNNMQVAGANIELRTTDLHGVLTYANTASTGYTLPANDTLTVWTALISIPGVGGTTASNLDSLKAQYDRAVKFWRNHGKSDSWDVCIWSSCCTYPTRGDINLDGRIDLSDLSRLICYTTGCILPPGVPKLPCPAAANVNAVGIIDLSDLSLLVAYLTVSPRPTLPPCGP